jgi:hypothetical protein
VLFQGAEVLGKLSAYFRNESADRNMLQDLYLLQFARDCGVPVWGLWGTHSSLVQHVGLKSAFFPGGKRFHWSFWFEGGTGNVSADAERLIASALARDSLRGATALLSRLVALSGCVAMVWAAFAISQRGRTARRAPPRCRRDERRID